MPVDPAESGSPGQAIYHITDKRKGKVNHCTPRTTGKRNNNAHNRDKGDNKVADPDITDIPVVQRWINKPPTLGRIKPVAEHRDTNGKETDLEYDCTDRDLREITGKGGCKGEQCYEQE